jgi:hypothetical protein
MKPANALEGCVLSFRKYVTFHQIGAEPLLLTSSLSSSAPSRGFPGNQLGPFQTEASLSCQQFIAFHLSIIF